MGVNSLELRIDTGPIHQQQPLNNAADTGPPTTQDSLSLGQLKKLVSEGVKVKVCLATAIVESCCLVYQRLMLLLIQGAGICIYLHGRRHSS